MAPAAARVPNLPIAADGWLDRMEKDPDEATVLSSGFGRDFSAEKEHLVLGGPGHQGNGISSGMLMATRRLDAVEAWLLAWSQGGYRLLAGDRDREQLRD